MGWGRVWSCCARTLLLLLLLTVSVPGPGYLDKGRGVSRNASRGGRDAAKRAFLLYVSRCTDSDSNSDELFPGSSHLLNFTPLHPHAPICRHPTSVCPHPNPERCIRTFVRANSFSPTGV
ncbi:hypothetical protein BD413DRAFT_285039 [Trametes elegans]|nr:hypothetical protein BD413DRAFT_285039 [Trametes elegans]